MAKNNKPEREHRTENIKSYFHMPGILCIMLSNFKNIMQNHKKLWGFWVIKN